MGYQLVIAEKPSVAQSIAKVIGADRRKDGYLEGNSYIVSWCVGHLVELSEPQEYDAKYAKWRKEDLPILPEPFQYQVSESTKKQFWKLKELMEREDVESLIEATDAGREGELIFRLVYEQAGCSKPFWRLWISSMEDKAIADGFRNLKPSAEYDALYHAALCRERADWIVGINATRLFSTLYGQTLNVGRVMTPTLAMLTDREAEIRGFQSEPFYTVQLTAGGIQAGGEKYKDREEADRILSAVQAEGKASVQKMEAAEKSERPPLLYDLTSLQRDANKSYGFTAQQTLDYTQSLYEKKLVTYPRTDSRYLTEDMDESTKRLACLMKEKWGYTKIVQLHTQNVINSSKVSDHHAIIPTENTADVNYGELPFGEQKILALITARLLAALGNPCRFTEYHLELGSAGETFRTSERVVTDPGWRDIEEWILGSRRETSNNNGSEDTSTGNAENGNAEQGQENVILSALNADPDFFAEGKSFPVSDITIHEGMTKPRKRYTENALLSAMERAGASEMPEDAERKGLGTPATRAGIIEKLVRIGFIERQGNKKTKYLVPTDKGMALITVVPEEIQSPHLTADWEQKLADVEKEELPPKEFMQEIRDMVKTLVESYELVKDASVLMNPAHKPIGTCPSCGADIVEKQKGYFCGNRDCCFALWKESRYFTAIGKTMTKQIAENLLRTGKVNLRKCKSKKTGSTYDATVVLTVNEQGQAAFSMEFPDRKSDGGIRKYPGYGGPRYAQESRDISRRNEV